MITLIHAIKNSLQHHIQNSHIQSWNFSSLWKII